MKLALLITLSSLVQLMRAQGITRPFLNRTDINDQAFNAYGTIEGYTSWVRNGFSANADLDLTLGFTITNSPNSAFDAINNYQIIAFLSHNDTSTDSDFVKISSLGSGSSVRDVVSVAENTRQGWKDLSRKVGDAIPTVSGSSTYTFRVSSTSAVSSSTINKQLWQLDTRSTRRDTTAGTMKIVFKRDRE